MWIFKTKSVLKDKTDKEKNDYFVALRILCRTDVSIFKSQVKLLNANEQLEFLHWIEQDNQNKRTMLGLIGVLDTLLKDVQNQRSN